MTWWDLHSRQVVWLGVLAFLAAFWSAVACGVVWVWR